MLNEMLTGAVVVLLAVDGAVLGLRAAPIGAHASAAHACTTALRAVNGLRDGSLDRSEFSQRMRQAGSAADSAAAGDRRFRRSFAQVSFGIEQLQVIMIQSRTPAEMRGVGPSSDVDQFVALCREVLR